jgi:hypothetical protein
LKTYNNKDYIFNRTKINEFVDANPETYLIYDTRQDFNEITEDGKIKLIPYDKGGSTKINGELTDFFKYPEFLVRWDKDAIDYYKSVGGMRNSDKYFQTGIHFSGSGQYCPIFRISNQTVFDADYPLILSSQYSTEALILIFCSPIGQYICKKILNSSAHFKNGDVEDFPIIEINSLQENQLIKLSELMIEKRRNRVKICIEDYKEMNHIVCEIYHISSTDEEIALNWFLKFKLHVTS